MYREVVQIVYVNYIYKPYYLYLTYLQSVRLTSKIFESRNDVDFPEINIQILCNWIHIPPRSS
jgi:hypothetical protein